jgi:putative endonuclease
MLSSWFKKRVPTRAEHLETGIWGEALAEKYLRDKGMKILGRRLRVGKRDELDLLARKGDTLVFIEVKTRRSETFGRPSAAVNKDKRFRISRAAMRYMKKLKKKPLYFRFDIVEVVGKPDQDAPIIRHLPNAFTLDKRFRVPW